uniref:RNA ligase 1 n=1 Tax=Neogobius melanostomus TaxID=47308 RepID=A0A8C6S728_9GOBI
MRLLFRTMSPVIRVVFSPRRRRTPSRDQALSQTRFAKINEIFLSSNIFTAVLFDAGTGSRMRRLGSVQQKMPCVFTTEVKEEPSRKRDCQSYKVVATETLNPVAMDADVESALATEKVDGTCCYVSLFRGQPYLWARLDRKPNKQAEKRFKKHLHLHRSGKGFSWNVAEDFKTVPETWIPAHGVKHLNDQPLPDENGHIPGWLPVDRDSKQYCWHSSVVDYELRAALVLRPTSHNHQHHHQAALELRAVPLNELLEQTLELIGTNVNGNPYGLGSKKRPLHCLVSHGALPVSEPPALDFHKLKSWFQTRPEGRVEGVVWHCSDGTLLKLHRHHLGLRWPEGDTLLGSRSVVVNVDTTVNEYGDSKDLFSSFSKLHGQTFDRLRDVQFET